MIIDLRGVNALRQLRLELEESAGLDFPQGCLKEMLLLYDVCKSLEVSLFQARTILGAPAYNMVTDHINTPVGLPSEQSRDTLSAMRAH